MSGKYFFNRNPRAFFFALISFPVLLPVCVEALLWLFLHHPSLNLAFPYLQTTVADIYYNHELDIIQYQPQCARYDSALLYILKQGQCHHRSIEFDCTYSINRSGLRDDDASLEKPEIIVLGDSYAMGWGMADEKIFPSLLERATGMKTLNVAVPSYGTAREFLLLDRLDLSNLKFLIIQHCLNDFKENKEFVENGFRLKSHPSQFYQGTVEQQLTRKKYFPFLYLSTFLKVNIINRFKSERASEGKKAAPASLNIPLLSLNADAEKNNTDFGDAAEAAKDFLEIIRHKTDLEQVQIIVFSVSGPAYDNPEFIRAESESNSRMRQPLHSAR